VIAARTRAGEPRFALAALVVASAAAAGATAAAPTGNALADRALPMLLAGATTAAGAAASPFALGLAGVVLVAGGGSAWFRLLGGGLVGAAALMDRDHHPVAGALLGTIAVQAFLRLPGSSPTGASALVAAVGIAPVFLGAVRAAPRARRRLVVRALLLVTVAAIGTAALLALTAARARTALERAEDAARRGVDAAREGDREAAADAFRVAARRFGDARETTQSWWTWPLRAVPLVAPQLRAVDKVIAIGQEMMPVAESAARRVEPERLRLTNGRLDLATIARYTPVFDELTDAAERGRVELGGVSRTWLAPPLRRAVARFERTVAEAADSAQTASEAVRVTPAIMGAHEERRYFVAFVSPAEARGSGGFMGNYAVVVARDGRLDLETVGRAPDLNGRGAGTKRIDGPADYVARYEKFDVANTWENVTMSPDFPAVARVVAQLYPQSGGVPVDGVVRMGPDALARLLSLTGPVSVPGLPFDVGSDNAEDFVLRTQYTAIDDFRRRRDALGALVRATFDRIVSGRFASPEDAADAFAPVVRTRGLALWFRRDREQQFVRRIGADDAVPEVRSDGFGVVVQNGGGNKLDVFLRRTIRYDVTLDARTGRVRADAVVELRNEAPASGLPDYVIGNLVGLPPGTSRLYVSLYSPLASRGATIDGRPLQLTTERELGRFVYSAFVDVAPGTARTLTIALEGVVALRGANYEFAMLHQQLAVRDVVAFHLSLASGRVRGLDHTGGATARVTRTPRETGVESPAVTEPFEVIVPLGR
jgi:hypothetical protein